MAIFKTKHLQPGQNVTFTVDGKTHQGKAITPIHGGDAFAFRQDDGTIGVIGNSAKLTQKTTTVEHNRPRDKSKKTYQIKTLYKKENELILSGDRQGEIIESISAEYDFKERDRLNRQFWIKIDGNKSSWGLSYSYITYSVEGENHNTVYRTSSGDSYTHNSEDTSSINWVHPSGWGSFCPDFDIFRRLLRLFVRPASYDNVSISSNTLYYSDWESLPVAFNNRDVHDSSIYLFDDIDNSIPRSSIGLSYFTVPNNENFPDLTFLGSGLFGNFDVFTNEQIYHYLDNIGTHIPDVQEINNLKLLEVPVIVYHISANAPYVYCFNTPNVLCSYDSSFDENVGVTQHPYFNIFLNSRWLYQSPASPCFNLIEKQVVTETWIPNGEAKPVYGTGISYTVENELKNYDFNDDDFSHYNVRLSCKSNDLTVDFPVLNKENLEKNPVTIAHAQSSCETSFVTTSLFLSRPASNTESRQINAFWLDRMEANDTVQILGQTHPVQIKSLSRWVGSDFNEIDSEGRTQFTIIWLKDARDNKITGNFEYKVYGRGALSFSIRSLFYSFNGTGIETVPQDFSFDSLDPLYCSLIENKLYAINKEDILAQKSTVSVQEYRINGSSLLKGKRLKCKVKYPSDTEGLYLQSACFWK